MDKVDIAQELERQTQKFNRGDYSQQEFTDILYELAYRATH